MFQEDRTRQDLTHNGTESGFELDFAGLEEVSLEEEQKQRIHQELMSLEW